VETSHSSSWYLHVCCTNYFTLQILIIEFQDIGANTLETSMQYDTFGFTAAELAHKKAEEEQKKRFTYKFVYSLSIINYLICVHSMLENEPKHLSKRN
jgi:hypothetical protein